jgi:dTMP kinase
MTSKGELGRFITIEGVEGAGKSSCMQYVRELLEREGHEVVTTREPGGTKLGEEVRNILLGHREGGMAIETELLLMFAARCEHLHKVIVPAIEAGKWVICDRFTDSTFAYQGGGRGIDRGDIATLADLVHGGLNPDLTLLLDLPVEQGLARAGRRGTPDRFERETVSFFNRVRNYYLEMAEDEPERFRVIDAGAPVEDVREQIERVVAEWIESRRCDRNALRWSRRCVR